MVLVISKSEFAARIGVSRPRVTALLKRGLPVEGGGKINVEAAEAWMAANLLPQARYGDRGASRLLGGAPPPSPLQHPSPQEPSSQQPPSQQQPPPESSQQQSSPPPPPRGRSPAPTPPGGFNLLAEKGRETHYRANKAELDYKERDGQLLDAGAVRREWESIIADSRGRVLACPSRIAARLPHLTLADIAEIRLEITAALMELGHARDS